MLLPLILALQATPAAPTLTPRQAHCLDLASDQPAAGEAEAIKWRTEGGGAMARQCLGVAYANETRWISAAGAFEEAARAGELAHDVHSADYWAQAGNAWLAAGEAAKARSALDAAIASATLTGLAAGEAYLDRARARVALGDDEGARGDLDRAEAQAADDPLVWLMSANLARKTDDLPRAQKDIAEALKRSPDDASVQLEAGYIQAWGGNDADARAALNRVIELAPGSGEAELARKALAKLGAEH
jgi:tetratricopeptide (TPR) repeat protein